MNRKTLENIKKWIREYVGVYIGRDKRLDFLHDLKRVHSYRVADNCLYIAKELGWPEDEMLTCEAVGLLHDIGRFSQLAEFGTFHDPDSVDHGARGYEVLKSADILDGCDGADCRVILDCVHYHNCRKIPSGLDGDSLRFLKLIRDADKLDIIRVVNDAIAGKLHEQYPEIMLSIDINGPTTPDLIREIRETGTGTYGNVHSLADLNLMRITWINNINYKPALELFVKQDLMKQLTESLPDDPGTKEIAELFLERLNQRLHE